MIKKYKKKFEYSYSLGVYPTIELLKHLPEKVNVVYISEKATSNKGIEQIRSLCRKNKVNLRTSADLINRITAKGNVFALGVFQKYEQTLDKEKNHIVLVNPSTAGNVGTIMRTMLGFRVRNLAVIKPAVDIFQPEVIRSSMGSIFQINIGYFDSFKEYQAQHSQNSFYTFMLEGEMLLPDVQFKSPYSLVFGNEGAGLPKKFINIGTSVTIPQSKMIDSLNLAISVGITLYEAEGKNTEV
jgi:TrmH family RNA methyltransferase